MTLLWLAIGGTEAFIQWVSHEGTLVNAAGLLNPNGGMATIAPTGDGDIVLIVRNSTGSAEAHIQLTITSP